ncbi:NAD P-binding protein [Gloeophyllum trabeum ATCC 11539]|uniref:NAD P-binding protein n=1 Tax=Gloeophyllum trabeum (strain ATCC 11539 / FP-39264 / Madison 617) TaxID=670483 RepID=S7Q794_GLOTA|nr:NAD P-binding protein [Gloeophyllum trabeum ATCC 11539]EPQ55397.1 NAD P-binding protein [Gloeophyllum trabeum ATCC 11539]
MSGVGRLAGKVALITGAGRGIGLAATKRFLAEGAKVVLADIDLSAAQKDAELLKEQYKDSVTFIRGDVAKEKDVKASCQLPLEKWGKLDVALLNAGVSHLLQPWLTTDESVLDRILAVNVKGPWLGMKHSAAAMIASPHKGKGCSIVLTSSVASLYGHPAFSAYVASKWAVRGLGLAGAQEFARHGIRVNTVQPGATDTRVFWDAAPGGMQDKVAMGALNVMGRLADPGEVASVMLFLASDEASFMTGSTVAVHAGATPT